MLLIISVWLRFRLSESPAFAKLKEEGDVCTAPLREAFGRWDNLKRVLIAFFGIMTAQGAVWYLSFFYVQVFLTRSLGVPEPTKDALVLAMTVASAPLYVFFGWLSDRVGRKPVMLGGMILALIAYYPAFHGIAMAANPALAKAQQSKPVEVPRQERVVRFSVRPGRNAPLRQQLRHRQKPAGLDRHFLHKSRI